MTNSTIIGIDPGQTGGIAAITQAGLFLGVWDIPLATDGKLTWVDGVELTHLMRRIKEGQPPGLAVIERVGPMPKQGVSSSFKFGVGFGSILSVVQAQFLPIHLVTPAVWKRALGLSSGKKSSLHKARLLYPAADLRLAKHDGRAEALLLAHYWLNKQGTTQP
jgi:hypothetical protein